MNFQVIRQFFGLPLAKATSLTDQLVASVDDGIQATKDTYKQLVEVTAKMFPGQKIVQVNFVRSIVGLQHLLRYESPATFIEKISSGSRSMAIDFPINSNNPNSWLDITYLDENLRISRGNQGSVFVLTKD